MGDVEGLALDGRSRNANFEFSYHAVYESAKFVFLDTDILDTILPVSLFGYMYCRVQLHAKILTKTLTLTYIYMRCC